MMLRRLLPATVALTLVGVPASAADRTLQGLKRALGHLQAEPAAASAAERAARSAEGLASGREDVVDARVELRALLPELERRHRTRLLAFSQDAAKPLPAKARERLERARAAYEAGQGRLLAHVRRLVRDRPADERAASAAALTPEASILESLEILGRIEEAARTEPWSASDLKVKAPALRAPAFEPPAGAAAAGAAAPENAPPMGYVHPELKAQADALEDPISVFEWVRNSIRPELYHGVMKGPLETMREAGGNDADTASLVVALLRAKGIPARFVRGKVELPARVAQSLAGTATTDQAVRAFARAGIPHEEVTGPAGVTAVKVERVWAEAYLPYINYRGAPVDVSGKFWIPLDAAFKLVADPQGLDLAKDLGLDARAVWDEYLGGPQAKTPREFLKERVAALLVERKPGTTLEAAMNQRSFFAESLGLLPSSLPYKVLQVSDYGFALPESLRHEVRFTADAEGASILDVTLAASDLLGRRLTIAYEPFSDEDEATVRLYGGLLGTPPYLVEVKTLLKVGGIPVAAAEGPIGMGVRYTFGLEVKAPGGSERVLNRLIAGNLTAIGIGGARVPPKDQDDSEAARVLSGLAMTYLQRWTASDEELANLFRVVPLRPTLSACFVLSDIEVEYAGGDPLYPVSFEWKGIAVDADLRASAPVAVERREQEFAFTLWSGLEGSILENRLFEDELEIPSVSTAKVLQLAPGQGLEVLSLDRGNVDLLLPALPLDEGVKAEIQDAVGRGLLVRVPEGPVTSMAWTGVGYVLLDEETGEAAWQLQGGHSGGVTAPSVIELPQELVDVLRKSSETPAIEPGGVAFLQKYGSGDFQFGTVNKELEKAFQVLVTDIDGYPVPKAPVTFQVIGGEGELRDAANLASGSAITVLSCDVDDLSPNCAGLKPGEARAFLKLGKDTSLLPRFFCEEGQNCDCPEGQICDPDVVDYATQVGLNLVTVSSGAVHLPEPFTAFGKPDDQFDGVFRYVYLKFGVPPRGYTGGPTWGNLSVPDRTGILVRDLHGNPISNARIQFKYRPAPIVGDPGPGRSRLREGTTTPGHVLKPFDYEKCIKTSSSVIYGQCAGEAEQVLVKSSTFGSSAYPLIGDSPYSFYFYDIGTTVEPNVLWARYATTGPICYSPNPDDCGHSGRAPSLGLSSGTRPYLVNTSGNLVEAYKVGGQGALGTWIDAVEEGYVVEAFTYTPPDGLPHYRVKGDNVWTRKHLQDSEFALSPKTPGTGAPGAAPHVGGGRYEAPMTMGPQPQLNTVEYTGTHHPEEFLYKEFFRAEIYPEDTDGVVARKRKYRNWVGKGDFSLWGIEPAITDVSPKPVLLSGMGVVSRASGIKHEIRPDEYRKLLQNTQVRFDLNGADATGQPKRILSAFGSDGTDFQIPVGQPLAPGVYLGQVTVLGVSSVEKRADIASELFPVEVCSLLNLETPVVVVGLTLDPLNGTTCQNDGTLIFALCRDSKVTITLDGDVLRASVDGGSKTSLKDYPLGAGLHAVAFPATEFSLLLDKRTPFRVESVDSIDPGLLAVADGVVVNALVNRSVLPVGHTFAKGVDLLDGHLVQQSTDLRVPGRHLGLEVTRTYSSAGKSEEGVVGAGWALNYASRVTPADCGVVVVTTAEGSSQVFQQEGGGTFKPQKGYHTTLVKNPDGTYDFTDKGGTVHHFREPDDPLRANGSLRLEYVREPHGDRLVLTYDQEGRVEKVAEVQGGYETRSLKLTYARLIGGFDRVLSAEIEALSLRVDYEYDQWGNLVKATRSGANVIGPAAPPRVEQYEYSAQNALDRHQMAAAIDANGNRREYRYYAFDEQFPGEGGGFSVTGREEYVKEVLEFARPGNYTTRFRYDFTDVTSLRNWKTTVRDARGNDTLYVLNGNGSPVRIVEPLGKSSETEWAAADIFKLEETDALGRVTRFAHDDRANLTEETIVAGALGNVTTEYAYEPDFNKMTRKVDANGHVTTWTIDPDTGDVLDMTDAEGNRTRYEYDSAGQLTATVDARGNRTAHSNHDSFGHPRQSVDPEGNTTLFEYDARGRLVRQTDSLGRETQQEYDGLDRVTRIVRVAGGGSDDEQTITTYYPNGEPRTLRTANGATTEFTLDGLNRVTQTLTRFDGQALRTATRYDGNGNKEQETDRRGVTRGNTFDELNRLGKIQILSGVAGEGPNGDVASFTYDLVGNKTSETDVAKLTTRFVHDELYRVKEKVLPEGSYRERYGYDKVGNRTSFIDANDRPTTYGYDKVNRLIRTTNALGQDLLVEYDDPEGSHLNKSQEHDPVRGLRTLFRYDGLNRLISKELRLEGEDGLPGPGPTYTISTTYDDSSHSMTVKDPRGFLTRSRLDGLDRVTEQTVDPGGLALTTTTLYDGLGKPKSTTDPRNNPTLFRHDGLGRQVEMTDARGRTMAYSYDGEGLKTSETDRRGVRRAFGYDNLGRLRRTVLTPVPGLSGVPWSSETEYQDVARRRIETDARGNQTTFLLDRLGRVVREIDADAKFRDFVYDGVDKREETDKRPAHHRTLFDYDALHRLIRVTDPAPFGSQTAETFYDDSSNRRREKDRRGFFKVTQMDPLARVLSVTDAGITLETNTYDGNGNKEAQTDADGHETRFVYDAANRLTARTDGFSTVDAATVTFGYDKSGNQTLERDQRAADLGAPFSVDRTFDALNRLETETNGENETTTYDYDEEGNRTLVREPKGFETTFAYDEMGKLTKVVQPGASSPVTLHAYDPNRNRLRQTDARGHVVAMAYDKLNRVERMEQPGSLVTVHGYDANGNETSLVDPNGQVVSTTFDELNRQKTKAYAQATTAPDPWRHTTGIVYSYDPNGSLTQAEEEVSSRGPPAGSEVLTTIRTYDDLDRLESETTTLPDEPALGPRTRKVTYEYFDSGVRKAVIDPGGVRTEYTYDGQNRLKTATTDPGTSDAAVTHYTYWPDDLLKDVAYPNGVTASHAYDEADRLLSLRNERGAALVSSYEYAHDRNGNRISQIETNGLPVPTGETTTYGYDSLNRLETVDYPDRKVAYGYDAVGNRRRETERDLALALLSDKLGEFDPNNRLLSLTDLSRPGDPEAVTLFTYDRDGNQITKKVGTAAPTEYRYDVRDKMIEVAQGALTPGRYQYDFEGRRTKKLGDDDQLQFVYDQTSTLVEYSPDGVQKAKYNWGPDRLISLVRATEGRRYFSFDGLRSVTNLTSELGAPVAAYHLDAWGRYRDPSELLASQNRFGFTGHYFDRETNLYFAKARFYDPETARFTSQDAYPGDLDEPPSLHRYAYAHNRPTAFVDPTGQYVESAIEIASIGIGIYSLSHNINQKNWWSAAGDVLGIVVDAVALAVPLVPGGAGMAIKSARAYKAAQAIDMANNTGQAIGGAAESFAEGHGWRGAFQSAMALLGLRGTGKAANEFAQDTSKASSNLSEGQKAANATESPTGNAATPIPGARADSGTRPTADSAAPPPPAKQPEPAPGGGGGGRPVDDAPPTGGGGGRGSSGDGPASAAPPKGPAPSTGPTTWNEFQQATKGQFSSRAEAAAGWRVYQESSKASKELAIGRLPDTMAAEQRGFQRLNEDPKTWTPAVNDAWVKGGVDAGKPFKIVSPVSTATLRNPKGSQFPYTVFRRELLQLKEAGYTIRGGWALPPGMSVPPSP